VVEVLKPSDSTRFLLRPDATTRHELTRCFARLSQRHLHSVGVTTSSDAEDHFIAFRLRYRLGLLLWLLLLRVVIAHLPVVARGACMRLGVKLDATSFALCRCRNAHALVAHPHGLARPAGTAHRGQHRDAELVAASSIVAGASTHIDRDDDAGPWRGVHAARDDFNGRSGSQVHDGFL
jgi:hypothetical protein